MSNYTTEVRFICEHYSGLDESDGYESVEEIISKARTKVFDFDYPIYDENYRSVIETKILKHFYTREIGAESVGLWKLWLNTRLNEVMPFYNQMYKSTLLEFNPLYDVDITTKRNTKNNGNREDIGKINTNNDNWQHYSDTPQGGIDGLADMTYLTNATHNIDSGENDSKNTSEYKDTGEYLEHVVGKRGGQSYSQLIEEYRKTFLNIDMEVIHALDDLFINLW